MPMGIKLFWGHAVVGNLYLACDSGKQHWDFLYRPLQHFGGWADCLGSPAAIHCQTQRAQECRRPWSKVGGLCAGPVESVSSHIRAACPDRH
eukprot:scaffold42788_cov47-Prasinocladus_malaysianus.AAC.1